MCESVNIENKKQNPQKPPLSVGRIACEILAGLALGLVARLVVYVIHNVIFHGAEDNLAFGFLLMFFPPLYVLATAVSVYLVGRIGNQTGSFLATAGGVFLGVPVTALLYLYIGAADYMMLGIEKIILWPLVFLAPPIGATLGFNLTRRYKKPPSS